MRYFLTLALPKGGLALGVTQAPLECALVASPGLTPGSAASCEGTIPRAVLVAAIAQGANEALALAAGAVEVSKAVFWNQSKRAEGWTMAAGMEKWRGPTNQSAKNPRGANPRGFTLSGPPYGQLPPRGDGHAHNRGGCRRSPPAEMSGILRKLMFANMLFYFHVSASDTLSGNAMVRDPEDTR